MALILPSGEQSSLISKAESISPRVVNVERTFAPGASDHLAGGCAVNIFSRETIEFTCARIHRLEIGHREIDVIRQGFRLNPGGATAGNIYERQNYWTAINVMPRGAWDPPPMITE